MDSDQLINIALYGAFALLGIAFVSAIVLPIIKSIDNPKVFVKAGIGVGALAIVFFIGYSMAPDVLDASAIRAFQAAEMDPEAASTLKAYKFVGGAMTTTLVLILLAIVGLVYSTVARIIN